MEKMEWNNREKQVIEWLEMKKIIENCVLGMNLKSELLASKSLHEIKKKIRNLKRMLALKNKQNEKSNQVVIHSIELKLKSMLMRCAIFLGLVYSNTM